MLAIVAPGQGAQTPGFLAPWLELPSFAQRLDWLSVVSGLDLAHYGTDADADAITDTAVAQPLLVAAGMLAALELFPTPSSAWSVVGVAAGHSVGEITAAGCTGVLTGEQAMVLVRERGRGMAEASAITPTGMSAVIGGDPAEVLAAIERHGLTPANNNGPGQIVAAGDLPSLQALAEDAPAKARVRPLAVAGAFHTAYMKPGQDRLARLAPAVTTHEPRTLLLSNADGHVVRDGREYLRRLVSQITNPVRWDLCMDAMVDLGVTGLLELPPAKTLTGIAKRAMPGVELFSLNTPDQLDEARAFCARHGQARVNVGDTPSWMLAVSPAKGPFTRSALGDVFAAGERLGVVTNTLGEHPVIAGEGGQIVEWLVETGDIVNPGQPLARLYPAAEAS